MYEVKDAEDKLDGVAERQRLSNDLYWEYRASRRTKAGEYENFKAEWWGYDDRNWWDNVAPAMKAVEVVGSLGTHVRLKLDPETSMVTEESENG